jgi:DNA-directed RNA polymerase specialized sigma24 family protein
MANEQHTWASDRSSFTATRWTLVAGARTTDIGRARAALETLCQTYWFPLYAYVRRKGYSQHDAQDLAQGFFERLLSRDFLANVAPEKGKFRSFLLASMNHHLNDEYARGQRLKRGGGQKVLSLDQSGAEDRYRLEPLDRLTPEQVFEKQWILTLLETVLNQLRADYVAQGKGDLFDRLKVLLTAGEQAIPFAKLAESLGMTETATRMAASRLRKRYRHLLRQEIAHTVSRPEEIDEEVQHLFAALAR